VVGGQDGTVRSRTAGTAGVWEKKGHGYAAEEIRERKTATRSDPANRQHAEKGSVRGH